jgi:hypothetical protein
MNPPKYTNPIEAYQQARAQNASAMEEGVVAGVRMELRPAYDAAKIGLAEFSKAAPAFLAFIASVEPAPTPQVNEWLNNMKRTLSKIPQQLSNAIDEYDRLTYHSVSDNHHREIFVRVVRQLLNSHDGALQSLRFNQGCIETWFKEWEASRGIAPPAVEGVVNGGFDVGEFIKNQTPNPEV